MIKTIDAASTDAAEPSATPVCDATAFRDAMAHVASAVHVVTTAGASGPIGLTATAVASVSDAPPTVLVCIKAGSRTLAAISANGVFCINTLRGGATDLAAIFAGRRGLEGEARFGTARWRALASGAPVLEDAIAAFDCRLVAIHEAATHRIVVGEVLALGGTALGGVALGGMAPADMAAGAASGLIYRRRRFESV